MNLPLRSRMFRDGLRDRVDHSVPAHAVLRRLVLSFSAAITRGGSANADGVSGGDRRAGELPELAGAQELAPVDLFTA